MKIKKVILILSITTIIILSCILIPLIINGDSNSAQTAQVLEGKTFTSDLVGVTVQGTMKDFSDVLVTKTIAADKKGVSTVALDPGYYDSVQIDASAVYDAGVAAGKNTLTGGNATAAQILKDKTAYVNGKLVTGSMATLTSSNFSGTHSSSTAGAASNYTVKSTTAGYVANGTTVNTLAATTSPTIATTGATGTKTIAVKPGYYNNISVNQTAAYDAGKAAGQANSIKKVGGPYSGNTSINVSSYIKSGDTANNFIIEFLGNSDTYTEKDAVGTHPDLAGHLAASVPSKSLSGNTLTVSGMQTKLYLWTSSWGDLRAIDVNYSYNVWYKP